MTAGRTYLIHESERRAYQLPESFTIGRAEGSDIVVREPAVSRAHARIIRSGGVYVIETIGATSVQLNGSAIDAPHVLAPGDVLSVGSAKLTVRVGALPTGVVIARSDRRLEKVDTVGAQRPTIRTPLLVTAAAHARAVPARWPFVAALLAAVLALLLGY